MQHDSHNQEQRAKLVQSNTLEKYASGAGKTLLWFRNDLRLHDNQLLQALGRGGVLPVYCFDPRQFCCSNWKTLRCRSKKTGVHRARFLRESVAGLKRSLREIGSDLLVFYGKPEDVIPSLM